MDHLVLAVPSNVQWVTQQGLGAALILGFKDYFVHITVSPL